MPTTISKKITSQQFLIDFYELYNLMIISLAAFPGFAARSFPCQFLHAPSQKKLPKGILVGQIWQAAGLVCLLQLLHLFRDLTGFWCMQDWRKADPGL